MSGSFRTAPRDALHHLLTILPIDLRLNMFVQNTALRLYKVPRDSQLLIRLGGAWHTPLPNDPPTPVPVPTRARTKTTLSALAARVPAKGPRINPFPDVPAGAPDWNGRVRVTPKQKDWDYDRISHALTAACQEGYTTNVYCDGLLSNRDRVDGKQVGAASAALYHEGREYGHLETVFGETLTESDTLTRSLTPALDLLSLFLASRPTSPPTTITILTPSALPLSKGLDASPHEEQEAALSHLRKLGEILTSYPAANIRLQWIPRKTPFIGFRRVKQLAFEAIRTADLSQIEEPQTIKKQKEQTRRDAFTAWGVRHYQSPRTGLAYKTALRAPPDGKAHHTFQPPPPPSTNRTGEQPKAKFPRAVYSTFYRIITGHAFVGEYTQRFYSQHTPEQIACPCGKPVQTIEHVLTECPIHDAARRRHLTANGRPRTLPQLFENRARVTEMLCFLEESGACAKPRAIWEPD